MPIKISLPSSQGRQAQNQRSGFATHLSSRKLLAIATDTARDKNDSDVVSAVIELQLRKHYLHELEVAGLLSRTLRS